MTRDASSPSPLAELTKTRIREFLREPGYVFWVFGFPLLMAIGLGLAFREKTPDPPRVALTFAVQGETLRALAGSPRLHVQRLSRTEAERALAGTKLDLIVDRAEAPGPLLFELDPKKEEALLARATVRDVLERAAGRVDRVVVSERVLNQPGSRYIDFLLPGLLGLNLMGSGMWGIGFNLVQSRKRKLLRRYAVTPMRRSDFLLSYFFSRSLFLVMELVVLIGFGKFVFHTEVRGSVGALLLASVLGATAFAAIGFLIGARLSNTEVAGGWMNFVQLPMWLLSGSYFSYERFPAWLQLPIRLLPLTATNDALRCAYAAGGTVLSMLPELAVLSVWACLGFALALRTFRWQ